MEAVIFLIIDRMRDVVFDGVLSVARNSLGAIKGPRGPFRKFIGTNPFWDVEVYIGERRVFSGVITLGQLVFKHG